MTLHVITLHVITLRLKTSRAIAQGQLGSPPPVPGAGRPAGRAVAGGRG
jgi:hypothetical protein